MKRLTCLVASLATAFVVSAQTETLIKDGFQSGGYGAPLWKVTSVAGKTAIMTGGRGAWVINRTFSLGGGGWGLVSDLETDEVGEAGKPRYLKLNYGGLELGYMHRSSRLVHWVAHVVMGGGTTELVERSPSRTVYSDNFYAIEPSLGVDLNVATWLRIGVAGSYMLPVDAELGPFSASDLGGPGGQLVLKFGKF